MNIETKLKAWNKKIISLSELESLLHTGSDAELYSLVSDAVAKGYLTPVKSSGVNGNRVYSIFLKYRITISEDYSEAVDEISFLHPTIVKSGYLQSKPELYLKYKEQINKLNSYLFSKHSEIAVSKKERSFAIFDDEKQLEDSSFCNLLEHLGLAAETLCYYETPEYCFNDYIPNRKMQMTLLICENKDIWFNIRRRMYEDGACEIFETHIDGVVYGCGNKVSEAGALSEYTRFMGAEHVHYLYWGDIDRSGLNIYFSLLKNNPKLDIRLFAAAYEKMLELSENRTVPDSIDHRERLGDYESIYNLFSGEAKAQLIRAIELNKRIPQEIISYENLLTSMR